MDFGGNDFEMNGCEGELVYHGHVETPRIDAFRSNLMKILGAF